jgi:phage shock protein PspC (stress-responsive transcriptional regulator)
MAKTIFKSSDKSNFILNMTEEQYAKLASYGLLAACFTTSAAAAIPEFTDSVTYTVAATGLAVSGVLCLILAMISLVKKYVGGRLILPVAAFALMVGWGAISLAKSYDTNVGFYGFPQRGEGLLALIFYFSFFVTAVTIRRDKGFSTLLGGIIGVGLLNAVWAMIQIFTGKLLFYSYTDISPNVLAVTPAGLSQSPIFLAMVLSLSLTAAVTVSASSDSRKKRIITALSACLFAFVMVFTRTLVGVCGAAIGVIAGFAAVFMMKKPKIRLLWVLAVLLTAVLGIVIAGTVKKGDDASGYKLYDGYILWSDDAFQRASASGVYDPRALEIDDTYDVYTYLNDKAINIMKKDRLFGTGPEQLVYPQIYTRGSFPETADVTDYAMANSGTFDKVYNEYIYTAATRGIPSLLLMFFVLFISLKSSWRKFAGSRDGINTAFLLLTLCGALIFLIGCSNITFSPIYWACVGAACAGKELPKKKVKEKAPEPEEDEDSEA